MDWTETPYSSHVKAAAYDDVSREMHVAFSDGSTFVHEGVPREVFDGLVSSPSPGSFLHRHVKGRFRSRPA